MGRDNMILIQFQSPDKGLFQFRQEMQRTAQKGHMAPDGLTACQSGNGLIDHCLENGSRQIFFGCPLID